MMHAQQPPSSLKEKQRQEREALILQVAEEIFLEKGYYETSLAEIAARVGISKGTIYLHFPGKDELLIAILQHDTEDALRDFEQAVASASTARARLEVLMRFLSLGFYRKHTQLLALLNSDVEMRHMLIGKGRPLRDQWLRIRTRVAGLLEEGKAAGEFDPTIETPAMVLAFLRLFAIPTGLVQQEFPLSPEAMFEQLSRLYFAGITTHKQL